MRAVIFTRVSTANQAESGLGIESQRTEIEAFIRQQGWIVVAEHSEAGVSGKTPLHGRTGLSNALADVEALDADVLVVSKLDRVARDFLVQLVVEQRLEKSGARLVSVAGEGTDSDSPSDVLIRRLFSSISEMNGKIISERVKAALAEKVKRGERIGASPFGFTAQSGKLLPDENYDSLLLMFELKREGHNQTKIAEILAERNPPASWTQSKVSKQTRKWKSRTKLRNFRDRLSHTEQ
jgi:DNA invertase Pin-like site-specific DNA recombinase